MIDDWLQPQWGDDVRRGTRAAFDTLQYEVLHEIVLQGSGGLATRALRPQRIRWQPRVQRDKHTARQTA